jgi:hypothetical protein
MTALGFIGMCIGFSGCFLFAGSDRYATREEKIFAAVFWFSAPLFIAGIGLKLWDAVP